jgi:hypothetical protein
MTTTTKWQRPLSDTELSGLIESINGAATPVDALIAAIGGFYTIAVPEATGRQFMEMGHGELRPQDFAIPEGQWCAIGEAIVARSKAVDPLRAANHLFDWMNKGPSSYEVTP